MDEHWKGAPELPSSTCSEEWVDVTGGVSLRVLSWTPANDEARALPPIVFIPGWGSVFEGWRPLVTEWVTRRPIIYVESREKASAVFKDRRASTKDFTVEKFTQDIIEIIKHYRLGSDVEFFSSSLASTVLIDAMQQDLIEAKSSIFVAPNQEFKMPFWPRMLLKAPLPSFTLNWLIKFAVWAIERKVKEEGQKVRYRRTLLSQNAGRIRSSARSLIRFSLPEDLSNVKPPCAIISAESDKLHGLEAVKSIAKRIPGARLIEVPSNQYAHEPDLLVEIDMFHSSI